MERNDKYDGIILDIDGTLWNTTSVVASAWNRACESWGKDIRKVTDCDLQKEFGKPMDVIARDLWPELTEDERVLLMKNLLVEEHKELESFTGSIDYEGVVDTIRELALEHSLYIVSNCQNGYIELTMKKLGITDCIKDFECFGRTGKGKAENILLLMHRNHLERPVYVGDTQGDADACTQACIPFVWASYGFGHVQKYYDKIDCFSELRNIVES